MYFTYFCKLPPILLGTKKDIKTKQNSAEFCGLGRDFLCFNIASVMSGLESCREGSSLHLLLSPPGSLCLREQKLSGSEQQVLEAKLPTSICLQILSLPESVLSSLPSGCWQEAPGPRGACKGEVDSPAFLLSFLTFLSCLLNQGLRGPGARCVQVTTAGRGHARKVPRLSVELGHLGGCCYVKAEGWG